MTPTKEASTGCTVNKPWQAAIAQACARIAPTWPLDRLIAVNPWWELRDQTMPQASALLGALSGASLLMPADYFKQQWRSTLLPEHLERAAQWIDPSSDQQTLVAHLEARDATAHWLNVADWMDTLQNTPHRMQWKDEVIHQISQTCAITFQHFDRHNTSADAQPRLYENWLYHIRHDRGLEILMQEPGLLSRFKHLPNEPEALIAAALKNLACDTSATADYLHALLLDINGWASWVAWLQWQANLKGQPASGTMVELLAIRLAWDWVIWEHAKAYHSNLMVNLARQWERQWHALPTLIKRHRQSQHCRWIWQLASELAYQDSLHTLLREPAANPTTQPDQLQAVFCIDVRSEPIRRALERQNDGIRTLGFAGFFGLPIGVEQSGTQWVEPQLPGLLPPRLVAQQLGVDTQAHARKFNRQARLSAMTDGPAATFSLVEGLGLSYALHLLREAFFSRSKKAQQQLQPVRRGWLLQNSDHPLTASEQAELLSGILRAMGLTDGFAPWVLFFGHGASTRNNAQASALNCGACGGQSGLVNAQVLADRLNDADVRTALKEHGIVIPANTRFVAGLHDTVTDALDVADTELPDGLAQWLQAASKEARRQRAPSLGINNANDAALTRELERRATDWSELRPEWGLANNAAFIAAPRQATRHLDLGARCFLHDYDWREDPESTVLEQIMTAPMIVAHWINMQYYASVTDNQRYGSGNKMLHNVVGGHIGVFEGHGGDLRIGLAMQSVHDGQQWRHQPLRLSTYLAAPRSAIENVYRKYDTVRQLIDHQWLYVFAWQPETGQIARLLQGKWCESGL